MQNPRVFRTLLYSEPWHNQNQRHIQKPGYSEPWNVQNPGTYRSLTYSDLAAYKEPCNIQNSAIFLTVILRTLVIGTLAYSQPWHIQNLGIFITLVYSEPGHILNHLSEAYHFQNPKYIQNHGRRLLWGVFQKYLCAIIKNYDFFPQYQLFRFFDLGNKYHEFFNTGLSFT